MKQRLTWLLSLLILAIAVAPAAAAPQSGVALLIGNAAYPNAEAPLKEPVSDARALGAQLRDQGFDVTVAENLSKQAMRQALDRFFGKLKSTGTALIFFSGFGIQTSRQSYLIPVDAQIWNEGDVRREGFSLEKILSDMADQGASVRIAVVDASRHNPYERNFRSAPAGLAAITAPKGAAVMMSAPSESVISDGSAAVFVPNLIKELRVTGATVEQVLNRTRMDVSRDTKGQQVPSFSSSLAEDFAFASGSQSSPSPQPKISQARGGAADIDLNQAGGPRLSPSTASGQAGAGDRDVHEHATRPRSGGPPRLRRRRAARDQTGLGRFSGEASDRVLRRSGPVADRQARQSRAECHTAAVAECRAAAVAECHAPTVAVY